MATAFQSVLPQIVPFRIPASLGGLLGRVLGIAEIERVYEHLQSMNLDRPIVDRLLDSLGITYTASDVDLARIPRTGAAIVAANHPFGILDGAVLASMLAQIRPDVRFLGNGILMEVPEIRDMVIPVDPIGGRTATANNGVRLRKAIRHLRSGGMLVIFPAGEVSHFHWKDRAVTDAEWNQVVARLVEIACVPVVPAYVEGANSRLFQIAGMAHPRFRTALLGRELLNKRSTKVEVRLGAPIPPGKLLAIPRAREQADYLRWRTYLLASRERFKPVTSMPLRRLTETRPEQIAAALPADRVAGEVAALPASCLMARSGELEAYVARAGDLPNVLHELGRLREITFRAAGEGTGMALDLDEYDAHYLHLFVWNARKQELVGAYRLAGTDTVRKRFGVRGLYTASLFHYGDPFLDRLGPALELGRSFVRHEYQKGFAPLLLLWKGIGAFVAKNPRYKILFGPVSISNQYQAVSRELMVSFLEKYALLHDWAGLVRNRRAPEGGLLKGAHRPVFPERGLDIEDLSAAVSDIEQKPSGVPVLLRQYLRLGGKLLGFNVDPMFANALDGLILVNLTKTEPKLLERYLGVHQAATFLEFQRGNNATH